MLGKGQGAIELLVLLAMIALAGLVIYASSQNNLAESRKAIIISQAKATVNDLSSAASEVYSEGVGAKRYVYIVIPEGTDPERVYVNNTMINIGVNLDSTRTDVNTQTTMKVVQGIDFPTTPGTYRVSVTAKEGYVLIGNSYLGINPQSVSVEMPSSDSTNRTISFTNLGSESMNVTLSLQWPSTELVNLTLNTTSFVLSGGASDYVLVSIQTYSDTPLQLYAGEINVNTNTSETADINLNVNVVGNQLPSGVSQIVIETFRNSSYSTITTNFTLPTNGSINGSGWAAGAVTLGITNPSGSSISGYPITVTADGSGEFTSPFNPAGLTPGQYTATANQSEANSTTYFNVTVCSN